MFEAKAPRKRSGDIPPSCFGAGSRCVYVFPFPHFRCFVLSGAKSFRRPWLANSATTYKPAISRWHRSRYFGASGSTYQPTTLEAHFDQRVAEIPQTQQTVSNKLPKSSSHIQNKAPSQQQQPGQQFLYKGDCYFRNSGQTSQTNDYRATIAAAFED